MKTKEEMAAHRKEYYEANKEKIREHNRNRYATDPEYRERTKQRNRARYHKMAGHTDIGVLPGKREKEIKLINAVHVFTCLVVCVYLQV